MKKYFLIVLIILFILCGCKDKNKVSESKDFVLVKINDSKNDIYLEDYRTYLLSNDEEYKQLIPVINYDTSDTKNLNLEIKSKLNINGKKASINEEKYEKLYYSEFEIYSNDEVNSLVSIDYLYFNGEKSVVSVDVYNFLKKDYSFLSNEDMLNKFDISENEMFDKIKEIKDIDSPEYVLMIIKNNGYVLGEENNKLILYFIVNDEDNSELKKMVIS